MSSAEFQHICVSMNVLGVTQVSISVLADEDKIVFTSMDNAFGSNSITKHSSKVCIIFFNEDYSY